MRLRRTVQSDWAEQQAHRGSASPGNQRQLLQKLPLAGRRVDTAGAAAAARLAAAGAVAAATAAVALPLPGSTGGAGAAPPGILSALPPVQ